MSNINSPRQGARTTLSDRRITQAELEALAARGEALDFDGCSFMGTRFDGFSISGWHFYGCDFDAVSFANSQLADVRWFGCQGRNASFRGARLEHARVKDSNFAMSDWDDSVLVDAVFDSVDLREAWFDDASLQDVAMFGAVGADLARARIVSTRFHTARQQDSDGADGAVVAVAARPPAGRRCCFGLGGNTV